MFDVVSRFVWRMAVRLWLCTSQFSWLRLTVANDSPHVHAPGANPDRLLVTGDGASAGVGVRTHDLGLAGYLARSVTRITGRATDADIVVTTTMTVSSCLDAVLGLKLARFDLIILSLGANEALGFMSPRRWSIELTRLFDHLERSAPAATKRIVLSTPYFGVQSRFPRALAARVDRHARLLNAITSELVAAQPNATFVPFTPGEGTEPDGAHSYAQWADHLAPAVAEQLPTRSSTRTEHVEEHSRQGALNALGVLDRESDDELDQLTASARNLFGVPFAAVTLIDNDRQSMASAVGMDKIDLPRSEAFCDVTIRRPESLAIEDTHRDPRYAEHAVVTGDPRIRFYAGYPIESPDGHRIGALCVMDVHPRPFSTQDSALLRQIAQRIQQRLWVLGDLDGTATIGTAT